jgi:hypothetical protein
MKKGGSSTTVTRPKKSSAAKPKLPRGVRAEEEGSEDIAEDVSSKEKAQCKLSKYMTMPFLANLRSPYTLNITTVRASIRTASLIPDSSYIS